MVDDIIEVVLEITAEVFFSSRSKKLSIKHRIIFVSVMTISICALCLGIYLLAKADAYLGTALTAGGALTIILTVWRYLLIIHRDDNGKHD